MRHLPAVLAIFVLTANAAMAQTEGTNYDSFVPTTELYTANEAPPDTTLVQRLFTLAFTELCSAAIDGGFGGPEPQVFDLTYRGSYDAPDEPDRKFRLYRFNCYGGAYNFSSVFYGWDEISGLHPLSFASPTVLPTYAEADEADGKLLWLQLTGMGANLLVTNAEVDAATGTISATGYWRGIGDASNSGVWQLLDGDYALVSYDVDASYDGEVNPIRIYDASTSTDVPLPQ